MNTATLSSLSYSELYAKLKGEGLTLSIPPFVVHIKSTFPVVAEGLFKLYNNYEVLGGQDHFVDFHVAVVPKRRWLRPLCVFEMDGFRPFTPLAAGEAFAFLEWGLNWCVTGYCHTYITIHSAVLERDGRAILMPAPPGSGKSTLCAALMLDGWRLLSDEMALLDPSTGQITASPRPVSLKNNSIAVIRSHAPDAVFGPVAKDTLKGTVSHLRISSDSLLRAGQTALPTWLVFPKYVAGSDLRADARSKPGSLMQLTQNSFNHHVHGRTGFEALADLVDQCQCYDLSYSRLDEALDWCRRLAITA